MYKAPTRAELATGVAKASSTLTNATGIADAIALAAGKRGLTKAQIQMMAAHLGDMLRAARAEMPYV